MEKRTEIGNNGERGNGGRRREVAGTEVRMSEKKKGEEGRRGEMEKE